ncbi:MAG: autotransporter domain-containing protein [Micropepsaceae bacterium]
MRARSKKLLSGASIIAVVAAFAAAGPSNAGTIFTGPFITDPIINTQVDFVTINTNATVDDDANGDSFYNALSMNAATDALQIDSSVLFGAITNVGQMVAANNAISVQANSQVDGGFSNTGLLDGGNFGFFLDADSSIDVGFLNDGTIYGGAAAISLGANSDINGGLENNGLIEGAFGIDMNGASFELRGGLTNNAGAVIRGTSTAAISVSGAGARLTGGITNDGLIQGTSSANGIQLTNGTIAGGITNSTTGIIEVTGTGATAILVNGATFNGNITNSGQILGDQNTGSLGILITGASAFTGNIANNASGLISADATAVSVGGASFTGNVVNDGTIQANTGAGVVVNATAFTGNVTNNARITSATGDGVVVAGPITGTIVNTGTINGGADGIDVGGAVSGGITTSGTIIGDTGAAINVTGAAPATITQTAGLIQGGDGVTVGTALNLANGSVFNGDGGTLDGDVTAGGTDDFIMHASGTFSYLRGTATGLDQFDMLGSGTAVLGAELRGSTGTDAVGVAITAATMTHGGEGTVYIDDDTTINVTTYTQTDGILEFQLTSSTAAGNYGTITAGTANLGGRIAAYVQGDTFASIGGDTFVYQDVILGATAGTFTNAGTIDTNSIFFGGVATVNAGDVDITLTRQGFSTALALTSLSQNQVTVGSTLEGIYNAGVYGTDFEDLFNYLLSIPAGSEAEVARVYDDIGGSEHASVQEAGLRVSQGFNDAVGGRLDDMRGAVQTAEVALRRYADATPPNVASDAPARPSGMRGGMSIWGRGFGAWTESDGDAEAAGYDQDTGGFAGGLDFAVDSRWNVGGAIGWSTSDVEFDTLRDSADIDTFQFAGYGGYTGKSWYADAQIGIGFHDITASRFIDVTLAPIPPVVATANYDANAFGVRTEVGMIYDTGRIDFTPFIGLAYASTSTDGFVESGAGAFNLLVAESDADSLSTTLGLRLSGSWQAGGVRLVPVAEIAWRHEFLDENQAFSAAFLEDPATQFQIISADQARDTIVANLGMGAQVSKTVTVFLDYNGLFSSTMNTHGASAGLRATW